MHGMKFGGSMGLTTWAAFAGTDDSAVVDGDFAMTANEVQPVLKALRAAGINIVALHNHMNERISRRSTSLTFGVKAKRGY